MSVLLNHDGADPRSGLAPEELTLASCTAAPQVGRPAGGLDLGLAAGVLGALALGGVTLFAMSGPPKARAEVAPAAATPLKAAKVSTAVVAAPALAPAQPMQLAANMIDPNQSRANPLIVDNTGGGAPVPPNAAGATPGAPPTAPQASQLLSADEQFSARIGGNSGTAEAQALADPTHTVMQGALIPAVLETALNSDLPGYARAIVSRDVRGFDGTEVAIPRGSRLIGQYKSGLSAGQSRAFVVWTRLIRPDGVSIQLGSPVMDEKGETGLGGKVDRHFLQRFGGAMLLSVVSALPSALIGGSSTALVINSGSGAQGAASEALGADARISPTIRVPLGTPIQVFAARDLDFGTR